MKQEKYHQRNRKFPVIALLVSVSGFAFFYLVPFVIASGYAFVDNPVRKKFVGLQNFRELFQNAFFLQGLSNMVRFMALAIPLGMVAALLLALVLKELPRWGNLLAVFFLIPLVVPSAAAVQFWGRVFAEEGMLNTLLARFGLTGPAWLSGDSALWVIVVIYIWKNLGYNAVLFLTGLYAIPEEYYQCAAVFGANAWQRFRQITLIYLKPSFFLVLLMSFVNSFKIYREVYLIWNEYPPERVYLLQHFVNKTLLSLHYQRLVSAVYVLTAGIVLLVAFFCYRERKLADRLYG